METPGGEQENVSFPNLGQTEKLTFNENEFKLTCSYNPLERNGAVEIIHSIKMRDKNISTSPETSFAAQKPVYLQDTDGHDYLTRLNTCTNHTEEYEVQFGEERRSDVKQTSERKITLYLARSFPGVFG
ncbi:uncharacterized protein LOC101882300 [Anopheles sinensis]|uniref:Uncharacterized protein LOC101882300 n=1 Tax=Anopheles sinensis TaxID=74873 RepID=A0A084VQ21_ANOSI|nr:uncharacterized protein LOC101882300 [Anopheles sinensis]